MKDVEIMVPLKHLGNFRRTPEMLLTNSEISLRLIWTANCVISSNAAANPAGRFATTDVKLYIPVAILSSQDKVKLSEHLKPGFKRTIKWNKCQSKIEKQG